MPLTLPAAKPCGDLQSHKTIVVHAFLPWNLLVVQPQGQTQPPSERYWDEFSASLDAQLLHRYRKPVLQFKKSKGIQKMGDWRYCKNLNPGSLSYIVFSPE